jgi:5'-deoxynucleotidase YfbR-like HD superfamily hydrolase
MIREHIYTSSYLAGLVKRYSTWPMIRQQTVAEHCWRVAGIYVELFTLPRAEVLYYCLHHDSGELWAGDLPFLIKKSNPMLQSAMIEAETNGLRMLGIELPDITDYERTRVKIADLLEMHETGLIEYNMGNKFAEPIIKDTLKAAIELAGDHKVNAQIARWVSQNSWMKRRDL